MSQSIQPGQVWRVDVDTYRRVSSLDDFHGKPYVHYYDNFGHGGCSLEHFKLWIKGGRRAGSPAQLDLVPNNHLAKL